MGFDINVHDQWAIESQGRIQDRTREHLGTTDKAIVAYRRMLLSAIGQVANGEKPPMWLDPARAAAIRGPIAIDGMGPTEGWESYWKDVDARRRSGSSWAANTIPPARGLKNSMHLAEKAGLWTAERQAAAREAERRIQAGELTVVRLSFADQHGILRGKTLVAGEIAAAMKNGVGFTTTMLLKDTSHRTVFPVWTPGGGFGMKELEGAADVMMLPDPGTFRVLPWAPHTGWMLCDIFYADGRPMPLSTRHVLRQSLAALAEQGYDLVTGLEVEFHLFKLEKSPSRDRAMPARPANRPRSRCSTRAIST